MLGNLQIEALAQNCASCGKPFADCHMVMAAYWHKNIQAFEAQIELGLIGANVRNIWVHLDCARPLAASWLMNPDLHQCIRCKVALKAQDMVQPVFQIVNPKAVNPNDSTDVGIALNERVYFVHSDCVNTRMDKQGSNILII